MRKIFIISCLILGLFGLWQIKLNVLAEQSGSSPESGADSRIKAAYDWLVAKGANYGSTDAADWTNDWGTLWNRIMESAAWEPDGDLAVGDVSPGKTFYSGSNDRAQKTGTGTIYSNQSLVEYDDYESGNSEQEESTWSNTATNVWQDQRTGLYWSNSQGQSDNIFPDQDHSTCDFFDETTYPNRGDYPGTDADCGNAINTCGTLSLEAVTGEGAQTDWYLPSQKELQQAYIDGMYNQAGSTFTTTSGFWSSTEYSSGAAFAWYVGLYYGGTSPNTKVTATRYVRCVRRD